jgi:hypothetical protein
MILTNMNGHVEQSNNDGANKKSRETFPMDHAVIHMEG